mmetsp:Transcript_2656/g.5689  ORF Transcript_2656/g.5689 Transcript_2656/m.5689 type:complete len:1184 (-) Transcript_2656:10-3561(-)
MALEGGVWDGTALESEAEKRRGLFEAAAKGLDPHSLVISYQRSHTDDVEEEEVFEDPADMLKHPRILVSVQAVLALKHICEHEFSRAQFIAQAIEHCRAAYLKELTFLREQLATARGDVNSKLKADYVRTYDVHFFNPPQYVDSQLRSFLQDSIRMTHARLIEENYELKRRLGVSSLEELGIHDGHDDLVRAVVESQGAAGIIEMIHSMLSNEDATEALHTLSHLCGEEDIAEAHRREQGLREKVKQMETRNKELQNMNKELQRTAAGKSVVKVGTRAVGVGTEDDSVTFGSEQPGHSTSEAAEDGWASLLQGGASASASFAVEESAVPPPGSIPSVHGQDIATSTQPNLRELELEAQVEKLLESLAVMQQRVAATTTKLSQNRIPSKHPTGSDRTTSKRKVSHQPSELMGPKASTGSRASSSGNKAVGHNSSSTKNPGRPRTESAQSGASDMKPAGRPRAESGHSAASEASLIAKSDKAAQPQDSQDSIVASIDVACRAGESAVDEFERVIGDHIVQASNAMAQFKKSEEEKRYLQSQVEKLKALEMAHLDEHKKLEQEIDVEREEVAKEREEWQKQSEDQERLLREATETLEKEMEEMERKVRNYEEERQATPKDGAIPPTPASTAKSTERSSPKSPDSSTAANRLRKAWHKVSMWQDQAKARREKDEADKRMKASLLQAKEVATAEAEKIKGDAHKMRDRLEDLSHKVARYKSKCRDLRSQVRHLEFILGRVQDMPEEASSSSEEDTLDPWLSYWKRVQGSLKPRWRLLNEDSGMIRQRRDKVFKNNVYIISDPPQEEEVRRAFAFLRTHSVAIVDRMMQQRKPLESVLVCKGLGEALVQVKAELVDKRGAHAPTDASERSINAIANSSAGDLDNLLPIGNLQILCKSVERNAARVAAEAEERAAERIRQQAARRTELLQLTQVPPPVVQMEKALAAQQAERDDGRDLAAALEIFRHGTRMTPPTLDHLEITMLRPATAVAGDDHKLPAAEADVYALAARSCPKSRPTTAPKAIGRSCSAPKMGAASSGDATRSPTSLPATQDGQQEEQGPTKPHSVLDATAVNRAAARPQTAPSASRTTNRPLSSTQRPSTLWKISLAAGAPLTNVAKSRPSTATGVTRRGRNVVNTGADIEVRVGEVRPSAPAGIGTHQDGCLPSVSPALPPGRTRKAPQPPSWLVAT